MITLKNKFVFKVWEARITKGPHQNQIVAIKEVDLEELSDKSLELCSVSYNHINDKNKTNTKAIFLQIKDLK